MTPPPKDAELRAAMKAQVIERMRSSLTEQGSFGVMQTDIWLRAYKRAQANTAREWPTVKTLKKCLDSIDAARTWTPPVTQ
jgi:hypothetical protein